jgi:p-aminobenzoyl-glutamate transporter AbgT
MEYFRGSNIYTIIECFQVGIGVPILFSGMFLKSKVAQPELQSWEQQSKQKSKKEQFETKKE